MKQPIGIFNYSIKHIQNGAKKKAIIHIDGDIVDATTQSILKAWFDDTTSVSYKSFRNEVEKEEADEYDVILNCLGGHVGDALAIHDLLLDLQNKGKVVNTIARGIVASSGTLILLSGKEPEMSQNSWFMMHNVSGGIYGSVQEVENYAVTMRKFNDKIRDLYVNKSGMRKEDVSKLMSNESWLTAVEAKEKGLVARVTGEAEFDNKISEDKWQYADRSVLNLYNKAVKPESSQSNLVEDMKKVFTDWGTNLMNAIKGIKVTDKTTNEELRDSIGTVIQNSITEFSEKIEGEQNTAIANYLKGDEGKKVITDLVNAAVAEATKTIVKKEDLDNLATKEELTNQIDQVRGTGTTTTDNGKGGKKEDTQVIGKFKTV